MPDFVERWKLAGEAGDAQACADAVTADVELVSPLTDQFTFRGRDEVVALLTDVFQVVEGLRYHRDLRGEGTAMLAATATIAGRPMEEVQQLDLDAEGRIRRVTLAMRPTPAITALTRALGPRVARRQGKPGVARTLTLAGAFLDSVAMTGDTRFMPLAAPTRPAD